MSNNNKQTNLFLGFSLSLHWKTHKGTMFQLLSKQLLFFNNNNYYYYY